MISGNDNSSKELEPGNNYSSGAANHASAADMQTILDHAMEGFVLTDLNGTIRAFNKQAKESILKNAAGDVHVGSSIYEFVDPSRHAAFASLMGRAASGEKIEYDRSFERADGTKVWYEFSLCPVEENGRVTAICFRGRDITIIKESHMFYQSLFENDPLPKFVCDRKTLQYLEVNEAAIKHYGYTKEELLKMSPFDIRINEEHYALHQTIQNGPLMWDRATIGTHRKKNGELISVQVALHPINYKGTEASLVVVTDITELLTLQRQLANEKLNRQKDVTRATIEAQEKERSMLGRELHENVNQMLSSAKLFLNYALTMPEDQQRIIENSMDTLDSVIQEIRKLSRSLLPPSLGDLGLKAAIRELIKTMPFQKGTVRFRGLELIDNCNLSADMQLCIYRIIQEQLTNIVKYAACTMVYIRFDLNTDGLTIAVTDNGQGFDVKAKSSGIGLSNITNRASAFNAVVNVDSRPGVGTTLTVRFPQYIFPAP